MNKSRKNILPIACFMFLLPITLFGAENKLMRVTASAKEWMVHLSSFMGLGFRKKLKQQPKRATGELERYYKPRFLELFDIIEGRSDFISTDDLFGRAQELTPEILLELEKVLDFRIEPSKRNLIDKINNWGPLEKKELREKVSAINLQLEYKFETEKRSYKEEFDRLVESYQSRSCKMKRDVEGINELGSPLDTTGVKDFKEKIFENITFDESFIRHVSNSMRSKFDTLSNRHPRDKKVEMSHLVREHFGRLLGQEGHKSIATSSLKGDYTFVEIE